MKIVVVNLFVSLDKIVKIEIESIERTKKAYELNLLHVEKLSEGTTKFETIREEILNMLVKLELINYRIVFNYYNEEISFFNLSFPKTSSKNVIQNIEYELNLLIPNYKKYFYDEIVKLKNKHNHIFRIILHPKNELKDKLNKKNFNLIKPRKTKFIYSYQLCESILKNFEFSQDTNYGFVYMINSSVIFYVLNNGHVIESFNVDIDSSMLNEYLGNFEYRKLLTCNDEYFRNISKLITDFMHDRNVFNIVFFFSDNYTDYLKKLIVNNVNIKSNVIDYKYYYWRALDKLIYEK